MQNEKETLVHSIGKLKIFLGYCAGVGKTYRMLQQGIADKETGINVIIGLIETHKRSETEMLALQLPNIPRKKSVYGKLILEEMDLDKIIELKPDLVLIDELAHSNTPGSRHVKRYQDIEELLNLGINVYTTLNIQHIQSLVDIVYQITHIKIHEIVPNAFFEINPEIELVDLSPEKLQERMAEGKIYLPRQAKIAIKRFFKKGNLIALRELSLKYAAKLVEENLLDYRLQEEVDEIWPVNSKLLLGIKGDDDIDEKLLLTTHRMAEELGAEWYVVHVETLQNSSASETYRTNLYRSINLAEDLGGKVILREEQDITTGIVNTAIEQNINFVLIGSSKHSKWYNFFHQSVLNNLNKRDLPFNVVVVTTDNIKKRATKKSIIQPHTLNWKICSSSSLIIAFLFYLANEFPNYFNIDHLLLSLIFPLLMISILSSTLIGTIFTLFTLAIYDFFFLPPLHAFNLLNLNSWISLLIFIITIITNSWLGKLIRIRADNARLREKFMYALYNFSREIMGINDPNKIIESAIKTTGDAFNGKIVLGLPDNNNNLTIVAHNQSELLLDEKEEAVAAWTYLHGKNAGFTTNTLSSTTWLFVPLKTNRKIIGVLGILDPSLNYERKRLLEAFSNVIALALDKSDDYVD